MYVGTCKNQHAAKWASRTNVHSTCMHVYRGLRISCLLASLNEGRADRRKQIHQTNDGLINSLHYQALVILRHITYITLVLLFQFYLVFYCYLFNELISIYYFPCYSTSNIVSDRRLSTSYDNAVYICIFISFIFL